MRGRILVSLLALTLAACSAQPPSAAPASGVVNDATPASDKAPIPCSSLRTMRELGSHLEVIKNPKTGDSLEYVVVGDAAKSDELIVLFPGTGQTLADWPTQVITNSTYSPKIKTTVGYRADQDGPDSLCHDYRLVLFDYPGVGLTAYRPNAGHDAVASDVDAMLQRIGLRFRISTNDIDPLGWSLGTAFALKYAFLSPASRPQRKIHNLLLLATGPGGSEQAQVGANNASCVTTLFDALETATGSLSNKLKEDTTELLFPYIGQTPKNNGTKSNCTATVTSSAVSLSVKTHCALANGCAAFIVNSILGLESYPWKKTAGVSGDTYVEQRYQDNDYDLAYCSKAAAGFVSEGCTAYGTIKQSITDGGVCQTDTSNPDEPVAANCITLHITGKVTAIDDYEDLFTQWTYDRALVRGLNATTAGIAEFTPCPGPGSHGFFIQHPKWVQSKFATAMQRT
jgi:pimeloyl-ACP methyl ester carboxylesterase